MLRAVWVAAAIVPAVTGRAEGQGLPVRMSITAQATVLPLPAAQTVTVDSTRIAAGLVVAPQPADTVAAADRRRVRRVVVSYPGT